MRPIRLTELAYAAGLVSEKQYNIFTKYKISVNEIKHNCKGKSVVSGDKKILLPNYIKRPKNSFYDSCVDKDLIKNHSHESIFTAETDIKYEGYIKIENMRVEKNKKNGTY